MTNLPGIYRRCDYILQVHGTALYRCRSGTYRTHQVGNVASIDKIPFLYGPGEVLGSRDLSRQNGSGPRTRRCLETCYTTENGHATLHPLGFANKYHRFVPRFAFKLEPLFKLLSGLPKGKRTVPLPVLSDE